MGKYVDFYKSINYIRKDYDEEITKQREDTMQKLEYEFNEDILMEAIRQNRHVSINTLFNYDFMIMAANNIKMSKDIEEIRKRNAAGDASAYIGVLGETLIQVLKEDKKGEIADIIDAYVTREYGIQKHEIRYITPQHQEIKGIVHEAFTDLCNLAMLNIPVMMIGPAGTGKSYLAKQFADAMGYEFYSTGAVFQPYELLGFVDAGSNYVGTQFYKACKAGSEGRKAVFCFDEIDASNPEVVTKFNNAIANHYMEFPHKKIEFGENVEFIACANTWGLGASSEYVGRNQQDAASLDRFADLEIGYSPAIEVAKCPDAELLSFIRDFRQACGAAGIHHIVSYRSIDRMYKMSCIKDIDMEKMMRACLTKNLQKDDLKMIASHMSSTGKYMDILNSMEVK